MAIEQTSTRDTSELDCQLPQTGSEIRPLDHNKTPDAYAGSFLDAETKLLRDEKRRMPTDPMTGLPFVILPILASGDIDPNHPTVNYHHHFYNRRHPDLEGNIKLDSDSRSKLGKLSLHEVAGFAVRMSRGQLLPMEVHYMVHELYKVGPVLPDNLDDKFKTVVMACSGIVPHYAIDVTAPVSQRIVYMDKTLFDEVASPKLICTERSYYDRPANFRREVIGNFLMRYAIAEGLTAISSRTVHDFLRPRSESDRAHKGNMILKEALRACIDPMSDRFEELQYYGMVQQHKTSVHRAVRKYIHPHKYPDFLPELEQGLLQVA